MDLTALQTWKHDTADLERDERKRWYSPGSFFFSQGQSLVLAASYFEDSRLTATARGGVARKHRHRIHLALFGQLMASLEYLFKDFVAQVIDLTELFDDQVKKAKWIEMDVSHLLTTRTAGATLGALLLHSSLGWHDPRIVNGRYAELLSFQPIDNSELDQLERLWILRHSVAHNAGFVVAHDAARAGVPALASGVVDINARFISEAFDFLCPIARRIAEGAGDRVVVKWLRSKSAAGKNWKRDKQTYVWLKALATFVDSRTEDLRPPGKAECSKDYARANA